MTCQPIATEPETGTQPLLDETGRLIPEPRTHDSEDTP